MLPPTSFAPDLSPDFSQGSMPTVFQESTPDGLPLTRPRDWIAAASP